MSSIHRAVTLRNDDPSIVYTGEWTSVDADTVVNFGNFGPAFSPTLHTTMSIASFSLTFIGSSINVLGTINLANSSSTNPNPTWECFLDGVSLSPSLSNKAENSWPFCSSSNFPDGAHELTVNVTSNGMPFYLDYINYRSSPNVSLENSLITIQNPDPAINYISGWGILNGFGTIANETSDPNGLVNVTFIGTQLSWYGLTLSNEAKVSSGEYSIDGGSPTPFISPGSSPTSTLFNQLFFITPNLEMGSHVLSVKYTGESGQTPLTLDWLLVANGSFPSAGELPTGSNGSGGSTNRHTKHSSNPSPSNNIGLPSSGRRSSNHTGVIGGVVSSVVGLAMVIVVFFLWYKFSRKRSERNSSNEIMPFLRRSGPTVSPSQTFQIYRRHTQNAPQSNVPSVEHTNTNFDPIHPPASDFAMSSSLPAPVTVSRPRRQPESSAIAHQNSSNMIHTHRILVRHDDSGMRLSPDFVTEEIAVPPTYTEQ